MKVIAGVIISLIILVFLLLFFTGIPLDKNFWAGLLNGLLSNLIIFIIAIFIIDKLIKNIEKKKLKKINERSSYFISFSINTLIFKILKHLKIFSDETLKGKTPDKDTSNFDFALDEMLKIKKDNKMEKIFRAEVFKEKDRKKYIDDLSKLIMDGADSIHKGLKEIYPHPAPDVISQIDEVYKSCGGLTAFSFVAGIREDFNKYTKDKKKHMNKKIAEALLDFSMSNPKATYMSTISEKLLNISNKAKENSLFID